jgi:uracil-DNA glycosylase
LTIEQMPADWREAIRGRTRDADQLDLDQLLAAEDEKGVSVFPSKGQVFEALRLTPFASVRAVILGQDPYHGPGQAHGLAFSTLSAKKPPSLRNILREWHDDCGYEVPTSGSLEVWARHGVLLLNTALTVRQGVANSHAKVWKAFTSAFIDAVADQPERIAFLLWGGPAISAGVSIDRSRHLVIESSHPSPFSFNRPCGKARPFLGSHPFSAANDELVEPIDWSLPASKS